MKSILFGIMLGLTGSTSFAEDAERAVAGSPFASSDFVAELSISNMFQITASEIAVRNTTAASTRNLAANLIAQRRKLAREIRVAATADGAIMPRKLDKISQIRADQLSNYAGDDFDQLYNAEHWAALEHDVEILRRYEVRGPDGKLKALASKLRPVMERQLATARERILN